MKVPFVDLKRQYSSIKKEIDEAILYVISNSVFVNGPNVEAFEREFAAFCGTKYAIGLASGTDALRLSLEILNIKNKKVISVANTFISTIDGIYHAGGKPVLADITQDYNISIQKITKEAKGCAGIVPVHLFGQTAKMDEVLEIAKEENLFVLEDASQAHGARFGDNVAGSMGIAACFSFYPAKNLGAYGDGGAITTNDKGFADKMRMLKQYGEKRKYEHQLIGHNSRLDEIQASILRVKLRHLPDWNKARRRAARLYNDLLKKMKGIALPEEFENRHHVYHLYVVRHSKRDELRDFLASKSIGTGIHYPTPIHLQPAYSYLNYKHGSFPETEKAAKEILSLPMFPEIKEEEIHYVCDSIQYFLSNK